MTAMDDKATIKVIRECCQDARRGQQEAAVSIRNLAWSIDALTTMLEERLGEPERKMAPSMRAEPHAPTVPIRRELLPVLEIACKVCRDLEAQYSDPRITVPDNLTLIVARARQVCEKLDAENGLTNTGASPLKGQLLATALVGTAEFSFQVPLNIKQGETWSLGLVIETRGNKIVKGCCISAKRQVDERDVIREETQHGSGEVPEVGEETQTSSD